MRYLPHTGQWLQTLRARPLARDKADTLLLLFSCTLVLAPYSLHLPAWITVTATGLLSWRSWITFRGNRMPSRWLLLPLVLMAMCGIYLQFRTFIGQEAGVATLVLLLTFKLLEMHARRDLFVVIFLSFFLLLTHFFHSQSLTSAGITIISVILLLTAQLSFQYTGNLPSLGKRLRLGAMIVGLAIPLTILLFVFFPRIQGPLWSIPGDNQHARSGLSDTMSPGNIAQLALSEEIAFRVRFSDQQPARHALYWRVLVLDTYDGRTWRQDAAQGRHATPPGHVSDSPHFTYEITQETTRRHWLPALELPTTIPQLTDNRVRMTPDRQLVAARPITARIRYQVTSVPADVLQRNTTSAALQHWLSLPADVHPRTRALAASMHAKYPDDATKIQAVLSMFRNQPFRYTLEPPLLDGDSIDSFLFTTRAGFCEHYASAFVVLMRAMGIPARIVTGYQGGQMNPVDGFMTIRQSDAHAWSEVWQPDRGWIRIDPTAAVAPERIERPLATGRETAPVLDGLVSVPDGFTAVFSALRFQWDALNNRWNQWVLNYTPERQKNLLDTLGFGTINWQKMILLTIAGICGSMLLMSIFLLMQRTRTDPTDALYDAFCKRLARRGRLRQRHEGPRAYAERLAGIDTLSPHEKDIARNFLMRYETHRYGKPADRQSATRITLHALLKRIQ